MKNENAGTRIVEGVIVLAAASALKYGATKAITKLTIMKEQRRLNKINKQLMVIGLLQEEA